MSKTNIELVPSEEDIYFRLINENNKLITADFINNMFSSLNFDHKVVNLNTYQKAMTHSTYTRRALTDPKIIKSIKDVEPIDKKFYEKNKGKIIPLQNDSYERLEFLGDSIIRHAIGKYLYTRYPDSDEGFLTTNRSKMENKFALSTLSMKLGLHEYALISREIDLADGRTSRITLTEDIFEAFIGALNLEVGDEKTVEFMWKIIETICDVPEVIRTENNYKDQLMQYFHKIEDKKHELIYEDSESTEYNKKKYKSLVFDRTTKQLLGEGTGASKKTSQQRAAKNALQILGLLTKDNEEDEFIDMTGLNVEKEILKVRREVEKK
jgi:ribonuclease-3